MKEVNRYVCAKHLWSWLLRRVFLVCGVMGWLGFFSIPTCRIIQIQRK